MVKEMQKMVRDRQEVGRSRKEVMKNRKEVVRGRKEVVTSTENSKTLLGVHRDACVYRETTNHHLSKAFHVPSISTLISIVCSQYAASMIL